MAETHDCGGGCSCSDCSGCIRWGTRCIIFQKRQTSTTFAQVAKEKLGQTLGLDEAVTINLKKMRLVDVGARLSGILGEPIAVPVHKALTQVTCRFENKPLSEIVTELGFLKIPPERTAKADR